MSPTAASLCSAALVKLGARPIASLSEGTTEALVATHLYPLVRDALLSAHPWTFATTQTRPVRLTTAPEADFAHAFALPDDFLKALSVGTGGRGRNAVYRLAGGALQTDLDAIILTYVFRPDETTFPPFFAHALVAQLAAEFCLPLTENASRADALARQAERVVRDARRIDSQQDSPSALEDFSLIGARRA